MDLYNIYCKGEKIYSEISEEQMFDAIDDLSIEFYQQGTPHPDELVVEYIRTNQE